MIVLQRGNGLFITLGCELAKGGEGRIYAVEGMPDLVAKIYLNPTLENTFKLKCMLDKRPIGAIRNNNHCSIAWPIDNLYDARGICVGFLMPFIKGDMNVPLLKLYNPKDRQETWPYFTWKYLLHAAINLSVVIENLHTYGYVIGDINESNILVSDGALVTLVDCDSIQVPSENGQFFRCTVGKAEYTPPELQGVDFKLVNRTVYHDYFGLAVLIFLMLMEGHHPFSGVWNGSGTPPLREQNIKGGQSPYVGSSYLALSPHALSLNLLSPLLQQLMIRCFKDGHRYPYIRPTPNEWHQALSEAEQHLICCRVNKQHYYGSHLSSCPWCTRIYSGIPDPFPSIDTVKKNTPKAEILVQTALPLIQQQQIIQTTASITYQQQLGLRRRGKRKGLLLSFLGLVLFVSLSLCYFTNQSNTANPSKSSSQNSRISQVLATPRVTSTNAVIVPTPTYTPTPTPSPDIIATPTDVEVQSAITYYYNNESYWAGQRVFKQMDQLNYGSETGSSDKPKMTVCVEYDFADIATPDVIAGTTRRTFYLEYTNGSWIAVNMGDWMSC